MLRSPRTLALAGAIALLAVPAVSFAQSSPAAPAAPNPAAPAITGPAHTGPDSARREAMRGLRRQMAQFHQEARSAMLAALTPEHRALLANVAGSLAIASKPDMRAASHRLDAALTPAESHAILDVAKGTRTKMRAAVKAAFANVTPAGPPQRPAERNGAHAKRTPSAGMLLLRSTMMGGGSSERGPRNA